MGAIRESHQLRSEEQVIPAELHGAGPDYAVSVLANHVASKPNTACPWHLEQT